MPKKFQKLIALAMMFWAVATDVNAESYVCMFDCFNSSEKCQTAFERNDLNFIDDYKDVWDLRENTNYLVLDSSVHNEEGVVVWLAIINKKTMELFYSVTRVFFDQRQDGIDSTKGQCFRL